MDRTKFRVTIVLVMLLSINSCRCQQNTIFTQTPFAQRQQALLRQQSFPTQVSPIITQPKYRAYNQYNPQNYVPITAYQNEVNYDGSFAYGYSAGDGTTAQAQGYIKNPGVKDLEAQVVQGSYSYTSPEGIPIKVTYVADENGFRAEGAHIPTSPPIPEAIAKSLQYIASLQPYQQGGGNPNLNPYQTPLRQFQTQQSNRPGQLNPLPLQQKIYEQQNSGKYQPDDQYSQQQRPYGGESSATGIQGQFFGSNLQQQQQQQQSFQQQQKQQTLAQQQQNLSQQQQNLSQQQLQQQVQPQHNQQHQQQLLTQQLQGRSNQILNPFGYNKYRRYKKSVVV